MNQEHTRLSVRSISSISKMRLVALKNYTRLTYGALLDDCIEALWNEYADEGHDLPEISNND